MHVQGRTYSKQYGHRWRLQVAFKVADIRSVDSCAFSQFFLADACCIAPLSYFVPEHWCYLMFLYKTCLQTIVCTQVTVGTTAGNDCCVQRAVSRGSGIVRLSEILKWRDLLGKASGDRSLEDHGNLTTTDRSYPYRSHRLGETTRERICDANAPFLPIDCLLLLCRICEMKIDCAPVSQDRSHFRVISLSPCDVPVQSCSF